MVNTTAAKSQYEDMRMQTLEGYLEGLSPSDRNQRNPDRFGLSKREKNAGVVPGGATMTGLTQPGAALPRSPSVQGSQNVPALMGTTGNRSDSAMGDVPSSEGPSST